MKHASWKIGADVEIPAGGADGVIMTQGGRFNGWSLSATTARRTRPMKSCGREPEGGSLSIAGGLRERN
jgi:arylsulfatase